MIIKVLLDCTVTILKILIMQYEAGTLSFDELMLSTKLKKEFLQENLSYFENLEEKNTAIKLLNKLDTLIHATYSNMDFRDKSPYTPTIM